VGYRQADLTKALGEDHVRKGMNSAEARRIRPGRSFGCGGWHGPSRLSWILPNHRVIRGDDGKTDLPGGQGPVCVGRAHRRDRFFFFVTSGGPVTFVEDWRRVVSRAGRKRATSAGPTTSRAGRASKDSTDQSTSYGDVSPRVDRGPRIRANQNPLAEMMIRPWKRVGQKARSAFHGRYISS